MKVKVYLLIVLLPLLAFFSCEEDRTLAVLNKDAVPSAIVSPGSGSSQVLVETDSLKTTVFRWSRTDFGVNIPLTYTIQIDSAGRQFSKALTLGTTSADSLALTLGSLNEKLVKDLKLPVNKPSVLEIRVQAVLATQQPVVSTTSTFTITPFKKTPLVTQLWVPGAYQNWAPATAPTIYSLTESTYEGYVYMKVGDYFKFTSNPDWDHINYGSGGAGKLSKDGEAEGLKVDAPGYYKFNVDVNSLTYSTYNVSSWGLIGTATAGGWDDSTPMTYDETKGVWTITTNLVNGALKFRANDGWDVNYGPANTNALIGKLIQTNDAINIAESGNYTITLDFSKSLEPHTDYTYTVKKN